MTSRKIYPNALHGEYPIFSQARPSIIARALDSNFGYGLNLSRPSGVKLLGEKLFDRLQYLLDGHKPADLTSKLDQCLESHGLIEGATVKSTPNLEKDTKSLNFWVHLVNGCNLSCYYCYIPRIEQEMNTSELKRCSFNSESIEPVLKRIFAYCQQSGIDRLSLKFAGGEPTLNLPLLEYFCSTAARLKGEVQVKFGIISNGTFTDINVIRILSKFRFSVSLSIDGGQQNHDRVRYQVGADRAKVGTWTQIWRNIGQFQDAGLRPYVLYTVTGANVRDLPEFRDTAASNKIGYRLGLVRMATPHTKLAVKQIAHELVSFYKYAGNHQPTSLPIEKYARFSEWSLDRKKSFVCSSGRNSFSIDQQGNIATCQMRQDKTYGNAAKDDFATIRERVGNCGEQVVLARPELRKGPCSCCEYTYVCGGGCPQHTKISFGGFNHTSPWCYVYGKLLPHYVEAVAKQMLRRFYEVQR